MKSRQQISPVDCEERKKSNNQRVEVYSIFKEAVCTCEHKRTFGFGRWFFIPLIIKIAVTRITRTKKGYHNRQQVQHHFILPNGAVLVKHHTVCKEDGTEREFLATNNQQLYFNEAVLCESEQNDEVSLRTEFDLR